MDVTVDQASDPCANFMLPPPTPGRGVCGVCRALIAREHERCYICSRHPQSLDAVLPISYSVHLEQLHELLRGYKDAPQDWIKARFSVQVTAILWRFLRAHERCLASRCDVSAFDIVTAVPSGSTARDRERPALREIVGKGCGATANRFQRVLRPTDRSTREREYDQERYEATTWLDDRSVLLIDDTWTTGRSAQSAASALRSAGATRVALVVIGRHIRRDFEDNDARLRRLPRPLDWSRCSLDTCHPDDRTNPRA